MVEILRGITAFSFVLTLTRGKHLSARTSHVYFPAGGSLYDIKNENENSHGRLLLLTIHSAYGVLSCLIMKAMIHVALSERKDLQDGSKDTMRG